MKNQKGFVVITFSVFFIIFEIVIFFVGGYCLEYTLETWLVYVGKPQDVSFNMCGLISLIPVVGQLTLLSAIVTFVAMLFIG